MDENLLDKIGQLAEQLDNSMCMAQMPLPDGIHKIGLIGTMREVRDELIKVYAANGGAEELNIQAK